MELEYLKGQDLELSQKVPSPLKLKKSIKFSLDHARNHSYICTVVHRGSL